MKWVIVTGDSKGLGLEIAKTILNTDCYGVIGISRTETEDNKLLSNSYPKRYVHLNFDLSNPAKIKDLYKNELKKIGAIHGLVNNAAFAYDDIVTNAKDIELTKMYNVNVIVPIMLTKYVIRDMLLRKVKGSIVHISSVSAHTGYKGLTMYGSTKGAIESFSKGVAREWGEMGIRSNCVAPGFMETAMSETLTVDQKNRIYNRTSLKAETNVTSVAETVAFLMSSKSSSITGQVIHVDNGTI